MRRLLREPLVQFLIVGAALFAASTLVRPDRNAHDRDEIVVTAGQVEHLAARFARTWRRPPTMEELDGLVSDYVREEVAYREGMGMGLDTDDSIIRRRIRQKLDFVASDIAGLVEPTEQDLEDYLAAHPGDFRIPPRFTFLQVYLDPDKRGERVEADASEMLEALRRNPDADVRELGDPTLLGYALEDLSAREVAGLLGEDFAGAIERMASPAGGRDGNGRGRWQGPLRSSYGYHLVRVDSVTPGRIPGLDEIRASVRREWENARRNEVKEQFYAELLRRYRITIEWPQPDAEGGEK